MNKTEREKYILARNAFLQSKDEFFLCAEKMGFNHPDTMLARQCMQTDRESFKRLKRRYAAN